MRPTDDLSHLRGGADARDDDSLSSVVENAGDPNVLGLRNSYDGHNPRLSRRANQIGDGLQAERRMLHVDEDKVKSGRRVKASHFWGAKSRQFAAKDNPAVPQRLLYAIVSHIRFPSEAIPEFKNHPKGGHEDLFSVRVASDDVGGRSRLIGQRSSNTPTVPYRSPTASGRQ